MTCLFEGGYEIHAGERIGQVRVVDDRPTTFRLGVVTPKQSRLGGFGSTGR
jgi:dUTPase